MGGAYASASMNASGSAVVRNEAGGKSAITPDGLNPSIFLRERSVADLFSDVLPFAMALQRAQGCFPSNVRWSAAEKEVVARLSRNIALQANDCRKAQCTPIEQASATTIKSLGIPRNT